ncbi:MAG: exodeoxyribonuclease VII large subunit [bacterium]
MSLSSTSSVADRRIYSVQELNQAIQYTLQRAFPGSVWVRGEVQRLPVDAVHRKHLYFELHDTSGGGAANYQIPVALLEWDRRTFNLGRFLDGSDPDFQLRDQLEVCLECRVDFYPPFGKLSLKVIGIDKFFTLGRLEAKRREVLDWLKQENLLELNASIPLPVLPLRVGLITSRGSAAERDFRTGLDASPYDFRVVLEDCRMQGERTEPQVVSALAKLVTRSVDVIVITRGGGSRGDLSWFDQKGIAVAIATSPLPVITAIGHEIDHSIADVVAFHACKTPTAAAEFLVGRVADVDRRLQELSQKLVRSFAERLVAARDRLAGSVVIGDRAGRLLQATQGRLHDLAGRLDREVGRQVATAREDLVQQRTRLFALLRQRTGAVAAEQQFRIRRLTQAVRLQRQATDNRLARLVPHLSTRRLLAGWPLQRNRLARMEQRCVRLSLARLAGTGSRLDSLAHQCRLLDPEQLLTRGYSLTLDCSGKVIRSAAAVALGDTIQTRLGDGQLESTVTGSDRPSPSKPEPDKGDKRGGEETETRQESLFR